MKYAYYIILFLLVPFFGGSQNVTVDGKLKITTVNTDNTATQLVVKRGDGTLATRSSASTTSQRTWTTDRRLSDILNVCPSIPPIMVQSLINNGYSLQDLVEFPLQLQDLVNAGFSATDLIAAGVDPMDLYNLVSLAELIAAGVPIIDLLAAGFTPAELLAAGATVADLFAAGVSVADLLTLGVTVSELLGVTTADLLAEGVSITDLLAGGVTVAELLAEGVTVAELLTAGVSGRINCWWCCTYGSRSIGLYC